MRLVSRPSNYREPSKHRVVGFERLLGDRDFIDFSYVFWLEIRLYSSFTNRELKRSTYMVVRNDM